MSISESVLQAFKRELTALDGFAQYAVADLYALNETSSSDVVITCPSANKQAIHSIVKEIFGFTCYIVLPYADKSIDRQAIVYTGENAETLAVALQLTPAVEQSKKSEYVTVSCAYCGFSADVKPEAVKFAQTDILSHVELNHVRFSTGHGQPCGQPLDFGALKDDSKQPAPLSLAYHKAPISLNNPMANPLIYRYDQEGVDRVEGAKVWSEIYGLCESFGMSHLSRTEATGRDKVIAFINNLHRHSLERASLHHFDCDLLRRLLSKPDGGFMKLSTIQRLCLDFIYLSAAQGKVPVIFGPMGAGFTTLGIGITLLESLKSSRPWRFSCLDLDQALDRQALANSILSNSATLGLWDDARFYNSRFIADSIEHLLNCDDHLMIDDPFTYENCVAHPEQGQMVLAQITDKVLNYARDSIRVFNVGMLPLKIILARSFAPNDPGMGLMDHPNVASLIIGVNQEMNAYRVGIRNLAYREAVMIAKLHQASSTEGDATGGTGLQVVFQLPLSRPSKWYGARARESNFEDFSLMYSLNHLFARYGVN